RISNTSLGRANVMPHRSEAATRQRRRRDISQLRQFPCDMRVSRPCCGTVAEIITPSALSHPSFRVSNLGAMPTALGGHGHAKPWPWHPTRNLCCDKALLRRRCGQNLFVLRAIFRFAELRGNDHEIIVHLFVDERFAELGEELTRLQMAGQNAQ